MSKDMEKIARFCDQIAKLARNSKPTKKKNGKKKKRKHKFVRIFPARLCGMNGRTLGNFGELSHALPEDSKVAVCGAKPAPRSKGWVYYQLIRYEDWRAFKSPITEVTCSRCLAKLAKQEERWKPEE